MGDNDDGVGKCRRPHSLGEFPEITIHLEGRRYVDRLHYTRHMKKPRVLRNRWALAQ